MLSQEVHQGAIFHRFNTVANTLGTQFTDGLPDAFRTRRFTRMNGNMPAGITCAVEMREEQAAREAQFIPGQVDCGDRVTMRQQRFQLLQTGRFAEGTAHDANQTGLHIEGFTPFTDTFNHSFNHACNRQTVGHRHIAWREAQFDIMQAITGGIFDVLKGDTATGIQRGQHLYTPVEFAQKTDQVRFIRGDLNVRDQGFKRLSRKR